MAVMPWPDTSKMSLLAKVGRMIVGANDDQSAQQKLESFDSLQPHEKRFLEETVVTIETAALLEDRRMAVRSLIPFTKQHRVVVGGFALEAISRALRKEYADEEMSQHCFTLMSTICTPEAMSLDVDFSLSREFCEIFLKVYPDVMFVVLIVIRRMITLEYCSSFSKRAKISMSKTICCWH